MGKESSRLISRELVALLSLKYGVIHGCSVSPKLTIHHIRVAFFSLQCVAQDGNYTCVERRQRRRCMEECVCVSVSETDTLCPAGS